MTPATPSSSLPDFFDSAARESVLSLARSPFVETMLSNASTPEQFDAAAAQYLDAARASGLPPEQWRWNEARGPWMSILASPLPALIRLGACSANRARAAELFAEAKTPLWSARWIATSKPLDGIREDSPLDSSELASFILQGSDAPLLRTLLRLALADPLTPSDFASDLHERFTDGVAKSSKTAKGVLGPQDKKAKAMSALVCALEPEILSALARRPEWAILAQTLAEAKERLAVKAAKATVQSPDAVKRSASKEQKQRLGALALVIQKYPADSGFILAGFEASPWLKAKPALACVKLGFKQSLLSQALGAGCQSAIEWLEGIGANPWLASAQEGENNACLWAMQRLQAFPVGADFSPIARMLLRGAWLDGHPDPKGRCSELAQSSANEFISEWAQWNGGEDAVARTRSLLASLERLTLDEVLSETPAPASESAEPPKPRRSAL